MYRICHTTAAFYLGTAHSQYLMVIERDRCFVIIVRLLVLSNVGKIKPKYSCKSCFYAKAIIRHIISFSSKNNQDIFVKFRIKIENTNTFKTKVHCFFFTCFNNNLFECPHLSISSDVLFNMLLSLTSLIIQSFSVKRS